jgi:hypothetical protein
MNASKRIRICGLCGAKVAALLMLTALAACGGGSLFGSQPEPPAPPPPPPPAPPPPAPPPVDLAGRWRLSASPGRACFMNFANTAGPPAASPALGPPGAPPPSPGPTFALQGTIAPEGGCPGNFFTSRKWTFEHGMLIIRDFKNQPLVQLSFSGDRFEGEDANGKLTLSR